MNRLVVSVAVLASVAMIPSLCAAQSVDDAVATLSANSRAAHSDTLLVLQDGRVILDERDRDTGTDPLIEMMSATKGVVALGVMRAIDQGAIAGLDTPVHTWYPQWKQGRKQAVTLRMLLNHTSGMQNFPNTSVEIYPSPDFVQLALAAELEAAPGERYAYNNKATNLLAGVIEQATGSKLDDYMGAQLFAPLGITDYRWTRDDAGNPHGMAGLQLRADDAAKLGQLVLDRGQWAGRSLIRPDLIDAILAPGSALSNETGLLWVRTPAYRRYTLEPQGIERLRTLGLPNDLLTGLAPLVGRRFENRTAMREALTAALGTEGLTRWADLMNRTGNSPMTIFNVEVGPIATFHADGYLGQYIVVVPDQRLVAVRQYRSRRDPPRDDTFPSLIDDLIALAEAMPDPPARP